MPSTKTRARQQWWADTTREVTGLPVTDVAVRHGGLSALRRQRSFTGRAHAVSLVIDRYDLNEHTDTDVAHWILAQQSAVLAVEKPRHSRWAKRIQTMLTIITVVTACAAVVQSGPWQFAAIVVGALSAAGAGLLWREARRERIGDVIAADHSATAEYGPAAAVAALTDRPHLYRSKVHEVISSRNPISPANRVARLLAAAQ